MKQNREGQNLTVIVKSQLLWLQISGNQPCCPRGALQEFTFLLRNVNLIPNGTKSPNTPRQSQLTRGGAGGGGPRRCV